MMIKLNSPEGVSSGVAGGVLGGLMQELKYILAPKKIMRLWVK